MNALHTDHEYEEELAMLRREVLSMGAKVEQLIDRAVTAFQRGDQELAKSTIALDDEIDALELGLDELCIRILARRQPVASDLRLVTTTLKLVTDLERVGDLGVNVCERVIELVDAPPRELVQQVTRIADAARGMLRDSLDAFVSRDVVRAREVVGRDRTVDAYYAQLFPELVAHMMAAPGNVAWATRLQSIGKSLERIADHATNVAEMVVFMVEGEDMRHAPY